MNDVIYRAELAEHIRQQRAEKGEEYDVDSVLLDLAAFPTADPASRVLPEQLFDFRWKKDTGGKMMYAQDLRHALCNADTYPLGWPAKYTGDKDTRQLMNRFFLAIAYTIEEVPLYDKPVDSISRSGLLAKLAEKRAFFGPEYYTLNMAFQEISKYGLPVPEEGTKRDYGGI